jgi:hypothetical protein
MGNGSRQFDMPHPLTPDGTSGDFYTALIANNPLVTRILVLTTIALVIASWSKNGLTKEAVLFRTKTPIVDGLRLENFAIRPTLDRVR